MCRKIESPTVRKERGDTGDCLLNQYIADFYGSAEVWNLPHFNISEIYINFSNSLLLELKNQQKKKKASSLPVANPQRWKKKFFNLRSLAPWWNGRNVDYRCHEISRRLESPTVRKKRGYWRVFLKSVRCCFLWQYRDVGFDL